VSCARRYLVVLPMLLLAGFTLAQSLYKYRGADGEWVYTDRQPAGAYEIEVRELSRGEPDPRVSVYYRLVDNEIRLFARNDYHAPVQVVVGLDELREVDLPPPDQTLRFVAPARQDTFLLGFTIPPQAAQPYVAYRYRYLLGDPDAQHRPPRPYRAPFAVARSYPVTQAYPYAITHTTQDAAHAVDIAMPVGTGVYAARGGVVIDVATTNFRGGLEPGGQGAEANIVRILHDDGTYAIYAHLNWNGIRVKPGDAVERGEYIADSGNTGFSTGPHLHFVVLRNADMRLESLPLDFEGASGEAIVPELGNDLTAYR
jgi:murein DD-endopeptidase MepM/ murein hydrolase activator NlpD